VTHTKQQVACPGVVKVYNVHTGGVGLLDALTGPVYRSHIRSKKWYHKIFSIWLSQGQLMTVQNLIDYKQSGLQHIMLLFIGAVDLVKLFPGDNGLQSQFNVDKVYLQLQVLRNPAPSKKSTAVVQ